LKIFCNRIRFYGAELLAPRPTPKLEDDPLLAVHNCLFNIFTATLQIGGRSSIRNLRTRHAMVTGTHLSRTTRTLLNYKLLITIQQDQAASRCRVSENEDQQQCKMDWTCK